MAVSSKSHPPVDFFFALLRALFMASVWFLILTCFANHSFAATETGSHKKAPVHRSQRVQSSDTGLNTGFNGARLLARRPLTAAAPAPYMTQEFTNKDCAKTQSCDLKSFKLEVWKSSSVQNELDPKAKDLIWLDMMVAGYETTDIASLEKYGIVQFIQGCSLNQALIGGKLQTTVNARRGFFDFDVPFIHPNWVLDSLDTDPLYASVPYDPSLYSGVPPNQWKRLAAYRIHKPNLFAEESDADQAVFQFNTPPEPKLYVSDFPTGSYANSDRKTDPNITYSSMNLRTCVYKLSDVPQVATPDWNDSGKAIACFDWHNNHRYDPVQDRFVEAKDIDPLCQDQGFYQKLVLEDRTPPMQEPLDWSKTSQSYNIPASSCDAMFGAKTSSAYFAGDLCTDEFNRSKDTLEFIKTVNADNRFLPNEFLSRRVMANGLASIHLSTLRSSSLTEIAATFRELKTHAGDTLKAHSSGSDADAAILNRVQNLAVKFLPQGQGCDGGDELRSEYDPVANAILLCPAWTNLPAEAVLEALSNGIADTMDVCSFKPIYQMSPAFVTDLKKQAPLLVKSCFQPDPDLRSDTIVNLVLSRLEPVVDDGQTEYEAIQDDIDNAMLKCQLIQPSAQHPMPKDFQHFATSDLWTCGREASGEPTPAPVTQPWKNRQACSGRVRDIHEGAVSADLMSYYLRQHPEAAGSVSKTSLLYSALHTTCAQQSLHDDTALDSMERLGLYLNHPEIKAAVGCNATSTPLLCEAKLF